MNTAQTPIIRTFWARHPEYSMPEMLTSAEKLDLVETKTSFDIIGVRKIDHRQYGETWILTIDLSGFARSVFLSCNEVRDPMIADMGEFIRETGEPVAAILTQFVTSNGYDAWGIAPAETNGDNPFQIDAGYDEG